MTIALVTHIVTHVAVQHVFITVQTEHWLNMIFYDKVMPSAPVKTDLDIDCSR